MESTDRDFKHEPSSRALDWVLRQAGPGSRLVQATRLKGGISSVVFRLEIAIDNQAGNCLWVMRIIQNEAWIKEEPNLPLHEKAALLAACEAGMPAPVWIASDPDGRECGYPAVLMSCLPGTVILERQASSAWLQALGEAIARLHRAPAREMAWHYFTYVSLDALEVPAWTEEPSAWCCILDTVRGPRPEYTPCLIHRDYHPANVLWAGGAISGIVDWINACEGPAGIDTGHCRLNLVQLYGVQAADDFLEAYLAAPGASLLAADPYWDMLCLVEVLPGPPGVYKGWEDLGVQGLTPELIRRRLDEYAARLAAKHKKYEERPLEHQD
ncbi:phosphotransferase family protein [Paenibacillus brevis]|uniref:Aminoglycoside phosphotransferase family protein n=1 Tax=Paenibacillus brevis TaxID=2841508 RepID=A0ABS6FTC7_9BACL|nr:aminoglycoside phosphotransferase family protein [Paenibacillus brevis]MBU5673475.1 aminoglycoside phosphotransferase family protein [Paenibacillus brevis]